MGVGFDNTNGSKHDNFKWQLSVLQILGQINTSVQASGGGSGIDYELRVTQYKANKVGTGYTIGDFISRTDIINAGTGVIVSTLWFNETTGLTIAAPPIADIDPFIPPESVTVSNLPASLGQKTMAGSLGVVIASDQSAVPVSGTITETNSAAILADTVDIETNTANLDVLLSTRLKPADTLTAVTTVTTVSAVTAITNALPAGTNLLGKVGIDQTTPGTTNAVSATGNIASGTADSGNPVKTGGHARTTELTAVSTDQRVDSIYDKVGKQVVLPYSIPETLVSGTPAAITDNVAHDVIVAQGAGVFMYITSLMVTNSHASVGTLVSIQDDASTVIWKGYAQAGGGGWAITFPAALKMPVANKKLQAICGTTGANVYVNAAGYSGV
jgi:hypothetical protein